MDKAAIIALYDQDQRQEVEYPGMRREITPPVVRHINTTGSGEGSVIHSRLTEATVEASIHEQVRYFEAIGQPFEWKVYDYDQPPDLKERLAAAGFEIEDPEAIMVLDLEEAPPSLWQPVPPSVQRITRPEQIADVLAIEQTVWDDDFSELGQYLTGVLSHTPELMSVYVATIDGQPASAAWIYFPEHSRFASLWGGSTISKFRRQGLYTALLAVRAQEARARQVRYLTVDASPMSRPILEKFGFEMIATAYACKWSPASPEHSRFASLWGGSTISKFRRQGLYTALLAVRAQEARARQVGYLTVDASPMSRPILEKFGFEMIATAYACKWSPASPEHGPAP